MDITKFIDSCSSQNVMIVNEKVWNIPDLEIEELISEFGGLSFDNGIFRIHSYNTAKKWTDSVIKSFPKYRDQVVVFGFDWLGRQYGKNLKRNIIYMFDISTGNAYELEQNIQGFFIEDLVDYADGTLELETFHNWIQNKSELMFNEIVGFKIPLWLGGKDELDNYERIDIEVDWEINRQLMEKIK